MTIKVYLRDRLYIPVSAVSEDVLRRHYQKIMYDQSQCKRCPYLADRHSEFCDPCQAFRGNFVMYHRVVIQGRCFYSLPRAEVFSLTAKLGISDYRVVDRMSRGTPLPEGLRITKELYDYQKTCIEEMLHQPEIPHYFPHGILKAPPRSGKTLMGLSLAIRLGEKFLILANQDDLLKQFIIELEDSTNIKELDESRGTKSYGICTEIEEFEKYDICLCTYQTFLSAKGKEKLKAVKHLFSTILVDEVHRSAAKCFSRVVDKFSARNRIGLTATEKRKDQLDFITQMIVGNVITIANVQTLKPTVNIIETKVRPPYQYKTWHGAMMFLLRSKQRQQIIMDYLQKDLKAGRKIVIPVTYRKQAFDLVEKVRQLGYTAEAFVSGVDRENLLQRARRGEIDVVVGIRSILSVGVNVPIWSVIYTIAPISNPYNYYQETLRVCTPMKGKPDPIIRIFVDDFSMPKGCFRTCWFETFVKEKFIIPEDQKIIAKSILATMNNRRYEDYDDGFSVYRDKEKSDSKPKNKKAWKPLGLFRQKS